MEPGLTFQGSMTLRGFAWWQVGLLWHAILGFNQGRVTLGAGWATGLGAVKLSPTGLTIRYPRWVDPGRFPHVPDAPGVLGSVPGIERDVVAGRLPARCSMPDGRGEAVTAALFHGGSDDHPSVGWPSDGVVEGWHRRLTWTDETEICDAMVAATGPLASVAGRLLVEEG